VTSFSRHIMCLSALSLSIGAGLPAQAQPASEQAATDPEPHERQLELDDCALVRNGVSRLACFDDIMQPSRRQSSVSEETLDQVEEKTDVLVPHDTEAAKNGEPVEQSAKPGRYMEAVVKRRSASEKALFSFSGAFLAHRPMYLMPFTWVHEQNDSPYSPRTGSFTYDNELDNQEAKYQISFKIPLLTGVLDGRTTLWFAYTQLSLWQVYNTDSSAPFRETNYQPELFVRYRSDWDLGPGAIDYLSISFNHESNGRSEPESRSWNRILGSATYTYGRWLFMVNPWYRIPENEEEDDNPDIENYLGYANYWAIYKWNQNYTLSLKMLNNLKADDNKTSVQLGFSFPVGDNLKGYVQYYNGYGESLIDYNERINRIGIGLMLNDWL